MMMKKKSLILSVFVLTLMTLLLSACGKSEFGLSVNTDTRMTITAKNAEKESFSMSGSLTAEEGQQIVITANLKKGRVKVDIIPDPENQSIDVLPALDGKPILSGSLSSNESISGTVAEGSYLVQATCLDKATGTVVIEVKGAE